MSEQASRRLLARLYQDLGEIEGNPYPGVAVFTDDANFRKLCLVLTPPSGPWKDLSLHFDVELPEIWPSSPPLVSSSVRGIDHPNLFGTWICCDLLKPVGSGGMYYTGGYSPALTLRGLFLQFLTFFSSTKIEQDYGNAYEIGDYMITHYTVGDHLKIGWPPISFDPPCPGAQDQASLEALWNSDSSNEVVVKYRKTGDGGVRATHSMKHLHGQNCSQTMNKFVTVNLDGHPL